MTAAAAHEVVRIGPNPGPQTEYVRSAADITIFGGSAGPGKSWGTLFRMAVHADRYPGYYGVVFRRKSTEITGGGGLWEESLKLFPIWGARHRGHPNLDWRWPNQSLVEFRHLQHAGDEIDHHGKQYAEVAFDELTTFLEPQFWYLLSRLRSTCGFRPRMVATCNPDSDSWVRRVIDWWIAPNGLADPLRSGFKRYFVRDGDDLVWGGSPSACRAAAPHIDMRPMSMRFIPARLSDNPNGDPTYEERLKALPLVERERLLGGNWNVRASAGTMFQRSWYEVIDHLPSEADCAGNVRFWDMAGSEPTPTYPDPDWTRGVKMSRYKNGLFVVRDVASLRKRVHDVDALVKRTAEQDSRRVTVGFWKDPGSAGKNEAARYLAMLAGWPVVVLPSSSDKVTNAKAASAQAEGGNIKLLRGPWNDAFLAEHEAFPDGRHDDIVDAESGCMQVLTGSGPMNSFSVSI